MQIDVLDELRESIRSHATYPENLICSPHSQRKLSGYRRMLDILDTTQHARPTLFEKVRPNNNVEFFDIFNPPQGRCDFISTRNTEELREHLDSSSKDPKFRYVSIQARSSRSPLSCTREMATILASHHQLQPMFLDALYGFRSDRSYKSLGWSIVMFRFDETISVPPEDIFSVPPLGRSGREIRLSYILRGVERSTSSPGWEWGVRQLGLHHVLDVRTGRALWVSAKGNDQFKAAMDEALNPQRISPKRRNHLEPEYLCDPKEALPASLQVHRIAIEWCDADWHWYTSDIEVRLRQIIEQASEINFDAPASFSMLSDDIKNGMKRGMSTSLPSPPPAALSRQTTAVSTRTSPTKVGTFRKSWSFGRTTGNSSRAPSSIDTRPGIPPVAEEIHDEVQATKINRAAEEKLAALDNCSISDRQKLHQLHVKLQEAAVATRDNAAVVRSLKKHYLRVVEISSFPDDFRGRARESIASFVNYLTSIEDNMERREQQLEQLQGLARSGKEMFSAVQHHQVFEMTRLYSNHASETAKQMKEMAAQTNETTEQMKELATQTAKDTWSMQKFTVITLIFLPGTFIAVGILLILLATFASSTDDSQSLMQSDIFDWDEAEVTFIGGGFPIRAMPAVFSSVCVIVVGVLIVLGLRCMRRKGKKTVLKGEVMV